MIGPVVVAFQLARTLCCLYAMLFGGKPERIMGFLMQMAVLATWSAAALAPADYHEVEVSFLLIDGLLLAAIARLLLRANRYWPLWMFAIHAGSTATHLVKLLNSALLPVVYHVAASFSSIPMMVLIAIAAVRHRHRLQRFGADEPWSDPTPAQ